MLTPVINSLVVVNMRESVSHDCFPETLELYKCTIIYNILVTYCYLNGIS